MEQSAREVVSGDLAKGFMSTEVAEHLLDDLSRENIIAVAQESEELYHYETKSEEKDRLIELVDVIYRRQIVRVSTMIHSKASAAVRDFARAFRFTKERE